jgi:hypothetical protein
MIRRGPGTSPGTTCHDRSVAHRLVGPLLLAVLVFCGACNFDAAFDNYCAKNPRCAADAAAGPEAGKEAGPEAGPDLGPDNGGEPAADAGSDMGPDTGGQGQIRPPKSCSSRYECASNEICHPVGLVCMLTCKTAQDCPPYLDTCAEIRDSGGGARTPKVCTCTVARVCDDYARGFVCHPTDNLCERLCGNTQDCSAFQPARVCDQLSGFCQSTIPSCASNGNCPTASQPHCDLGISRCVGCLDNSDCAGRSDGLTQCSATGSCVSPS